MSARCVAFNLFLTGISSVRHNGPKNKEYSAISIITAAMPFAADMASPDTLAGKEEEIRQV